MPASAIRAVGTPASTSASAAEAVLAASQQAASGLGYHSTHSARSSLRVAAHGRFWPHQNQVVGFLVLVHVLALAYWVYAFLKSRKEKARRARDPPRNVNCVYEWASLPKQLSHIRVKPLASQSSLDSNYSNYTPLGSALRSAKSPWNS